MPIMHHAPRESPNPGAHSSDPLNDGKGPCWCTIGTPLDSPQESEDFDEEYSEDEQIPISPPKPQPMAPPATRLKEEPPRRKSVPHICTFTGICVYNPYVYTYIHICMYMYVWVIKANTSSDSNNPKSTYK